MEGRGRFGLGLKQKDEEQMCKGKSVSELSV